MCLFPGCQNRSLTKSELRGITNDVVAAAQKAIGRRSDITIRPGVESSSGALADDVYISLADPTRKSSLRQALQDVARRHELTFVDVSSGGATRFAFSLHGSQTHTIHILIRVPARFSPPRETGPRLAIIVDDMGNDREVADSLLELPFPLTLSVLPHLPFSSEVAEQVFRRGDQVMLHLPMESESERLKSEPNELRVGMDPRQLGPLLAGMLDTVPHAIGVNNHEGSRATADPALMDALMPQLRRRNLFFIDSRTTAATVAFAAADRSGVRAASRKVFLDDTDSREAVLAQLDLAAHVALRDGSAIAIGHPRAATIAGLAEGVPRLEARGILIVFVSTLVR